MDKLSNPKPDGTVQGDKTKMGDAGTGTGMNGDTYGADLSQSALNSHGSFNAKSDAKDAKFGKDLDS